MSLTVNDLYKFGEFTLDTNEKVLVSENSRISLTPKVFDLLLLFVENSGKLITKNEILEKVWADSFVEESNLTFTVNQLRKLLSDNARQPNFIETIPRRGYRFIAKVEKVQNDILPISATTQTNVLNFSKQKRLILISALVLLISTVVIAAFWTNSNKSKGILTKPFNLEKVTDSGNSPNSAISPDGKFVIYTVRANEKTSLWRKQLETGENSQILPPVETNYAEIYIAKKAETLIFARGMPDDPKQMDIYQMSIFGGIPAKIVGNTQGIFGISPDEKQISFVRCQYQKEDYCSLFTANIDGSNEKKLVTKPNPFDITDSEFSPLDNSVVFAHGQSFTGSKDFSLSKMNLETSEIKDISKNSFFRIQRLKVLPERDKYLVSGRTESFGYSKIWLIDESGAVEPLTKDSSNYLGLSLDSKAEKLVATQVHGDFNIFVSQIANPNLSNSLTKAMGGLSYSPNGKIIFSANSGDTTNLWEINPNGSGQRQLTNSQGNTTPLVSRDGKFIFYTSNTTDAYQLWRMNSDGSNQTQITKREGGYPLGMSPDGKFVYYKSALKDNIWQVPIEGGEEKVVFEKATLYYAISPDGTRLASFEKDKSKISVKIQSLATQQVEKEFPFAFDATDFGDLVWSADGESVAYIAQKDKTSALWLQKLSDEKPTKIADLGNNHTMKIALAPDGENFAVIQGNWDYETVLFSGIK